MRKTIGIFVVLLVLVLALSEIQAFSSPQDETAKQVEQLKKQVTALEQRVKDLESRLEKLTIMIPQTFPNLTQLPKGWEKREFNGREYYVIPIDKDSTQPKAVIR